MSVGQQSTALRIARLVRVSTTHVEQADSPQHQVSFIEQEVRREGWRDTGLIYRAELTGAVIMDRPDIQRMLQDAGERHFDAIVLKSISRLGRDTLGLLTVKRMLDDLGVELIALADSYRSFRDPELIFLVHAERAQAGRQEISKNVKAGVVQAARRGIWPAGTLPFGLKKEGRFAITADPETAPVVQEIFRLRQQHWGLVRICGYLNRELQVKAPRWWHLRQQIERLQASGEAELDARVAERLHRLKRLLLTGRFLWSPRTVRLVLENPAYYGELRYNRTTGARRMHGKLVRQPRGQEDWVTISCAPLVTREEWKAAQVIAGAGSRRRRQNRSDFLLTGLAVCGLCGAPMRTQGARFNTGARGGEPKGYYICRAATEAQAHIATYVKATPLEEAVLAALRNDLAGLPPPEEPSRRPAARDPEDLSAALRDLSHARSFRLEEFRRGRLTRKELDEELAIIRQRQAEIEQLLQDEETPEAAKQRPCESAIASLMALNGEPAELQALLRTLVDRVLIQAAGEAEVCLHYARGEVCFSARKPRQGLLPDEDAVRLRPEQDLRTGDQQ